MSKAVGAIAGGLEIAAGAALMATGVGGSFGGMLLAAGISTEAGAIAQMLGTRSSLGITTRTPASLRRIIRGEQRVGGNIVYQSTTGSTNRQYNMVIVIATHPCEAIINLYLDGRQVYWDNSSIFNRTVNGVNFGGNADGSNHTGPNGVQYNFGGKVFCEAFYGNQTSAADQVSGVLNPTGGYSTALHANDPTWAPDGSGNTPYLAGCTWVYLKLEADAGTFPQFPEIKFTVRGKSDIFDPRTSTRGFTANWALHVADAITDPVWGLGDNTVNQAQLIAAANVCDELVTCAAGSEARYALNWSYDTGTAPGEAIEHMMSAAAGRLSRVGGEWYIWPAYWQGPSFTFDQNSLLDAIQWSPKRAIADLTNRVTGTYIAPNYPYNTAGNLYDSNGYWNGMTANNFPFAFQPTNFPLYACDPTHGYSEDVYLVADTPNVGAWSSGAAYAAGTVVIYGGAPWQALQAVPAGTVPAAGSAYWTTVGNYLPIDLNLDTVLSISQAQRLAKIALLRNRQQGSGVLQMSLAAYQMMPVDVMQFNMPNLGWTNKLLEIAGAQGMEMKLRVGTPPRAAAGEAGAQDDTPAVWVEVPINETDPSVYEWNPSTEELTPYDMAAISGGVNMFEVGAPSGLAVTDSASTAIVRSDGSLQPRILLTWTEPSDTYVTNGGSIQIQWRDSAAVYAGGAWVDVAMVSGQATSTFFEVDSSVSTIDVQIRSVRPDGATSAWVQLLSQSATISGSYTIGGTPTAPTASTGTNDTQIATTAFVHSLVGSLGAVPNFADDETVSGSGTSWTLAHTPNPVGSLMLVAEASAGNAKPLVKGIDYTISGAAVTTTASYSTGQLTAWYRY